jgi:anti-anti-sigma factor
MTLEGRGLVTPARQNRTGMSEMCIRQWSSREVTVIDIRGHLRVDTVLALRKCVSAVLRRGHRKLVLNVAHVTALDAAGLGEIVHVHALTRDVNGHMKLVSHRPAVQELLIRTRLLLAFDVYASEGAALGSFDTGGAPAGLRG